MMRRNIEWTLPLRSPFVPLVTMWTAVACPIDTPLRFGLYLEAEQPITRNYQIFAHLVAADGTLVAQDDHIAGADSYPTSLWQPGNLLYNRFELQPPTGTAPGEYRVIVGLYDERGRLPLGDGRDYLELFDVTITP